MTTEAGPRVVSLAATCSRGLEPVLADELRGLGAAGVEPGRGVVTFAGDLSTLYAANLHARTAMRVLQRLAMGEVASRDQLYDLTAGVSWEELLRPGQTFGVEAVGSARGLDNTGFAALVVKDAVVDRLRRRVGTRPDVDRRNPDVRVHVHLSPRQTTLSLDSSGEPLSHRGYRPRGGPAPLSETLAAGALLLAGYDGSGPLFDPMCGTGTIVVEAALIATRTAPGLHRSFACERWPSHRPRLLEELRQRAAAARRPAPAAILGWDVEERAVVATRRNARAAGQQRAVTVERRAVGELAAPAGTLVITNPPWGRRLGDVEQLRSVYREIGSRLKHHAAGCTAWLLVGEPVLAREIGLRAQRRIPLTDGPVECRLLRFDLVAGRFQ